MKKLNYRNDLQSLRGLSVILVFLFHFDQVFFKNLYIGVDFFFVISGYVITSSIFNSINYNKYDLYTFYLKRIKRIYPGLTFFIVTFSIFFFIFVNYSDGEYFEIILSSITSIFGVSNFFYAFSPNLDYFRDDLKWLQHTWSVSTEIQFYFLYGLIFSIILKFKNLVKVEKNLIIILISLSIISLYLFLFGKSNFISNYYSSFSRFWEFFVGCLIFLILKSNYISLKKSYLNLSIIIFISLILIMNFLIPNISHKLLIFFSVLSASFMIIFSKEEKPLLFHKVLNFYGDISYSFFLWHLPIISFLKYYNNNILFNFCFSFILTTIIALFCYRYVEVKFNKKNNLDKKFIFSLKTLSLFLIFLIIFVSFNKQLIFKSRDYLFQKIIKIYPKIKKINLVNNEDNINDSWILRYDKCENKNENFSWSLRVNCIFDNGKENLFFIIGNSYADHVVPAFSFIKENSALYKSRFENCYIIISDTCNDKSKDIINNFNRISNDFNNKYFIYSLNGRNISAIKLKENLNYLNDDTKIIFIYPHPTFKIFNNDKLMSKYKEIKKLDFAKIKLLSRNFEITTIDVFTILCNNKLCNKKNYESIFTDGSHFKVQTNLIIEEKLREVFK